MVRLLNDKNLEKLTDLLCFTFNIQKHMTHIVNIDNPMISPCIYAMWHAKQFCIFGLPDMKKTNVMISKSKDGDIIAHTCERVFGMKTVRGSKGRSGAIQATKQMIEALKNGDDGAITVDGPRPPAKVAKSGVIKIAQLSGVPIVPVCWYSNNFNFVKFPSWDKFEMPLGHVNLVNLYGKPIYVSEDADENSIKDALSKLQKSLEDLDERAPEEFNKVYRFGLWRRKK